MEKCLTCGWVGTDLQKKMFSIPGEVYKGCPNCANNKFILWDNSPFLKPPVKK